VRRIEADTDSATYEVTLGWRNTGRLPTALRQAQLVKIVQEDRAFLRFASELTEGRRRRLHRAAGRPRRDRFAGWTEPGESNSFTFQVRTRGVPGVRATAEVLSTRGGVLRRELDIGSAVDR
jgi:hypothetical protein